MELLKDNIMLLTKEEAKAHIKHYKVTRPTFFDENMCDISDKKIDEALKITEYIAGGLQQPEDEIFMTELKRICTETTK
jgi:hypothetical protein